MKNKYVTYDHTSTLFTNEINSELGDASELINSNSFMKRESAIDIPCSSGIRIEALAKKYCHIYCYDLSLGMLEECSLLCKKEDIRNVTIKKLDLKNLHQINIKVEDLYILGYAIQFLNSTEIDLLFSNLKMITKRLIIEIFDYSQSEINEKTLYFQSKSNTIKLTKKYKLNSDRIEILKTYEEKNDEKCQIINLFNYSSSYFENILMNNGFNLVCKYSDYKRTSYTKGPRVILVLENKIMGD